MAAIFDIPRANAPLIVAGGLPSREWYSYWQNLQPASGGPSNADLANDIAIISDKLGSPDGTPEHIPPSAGAGIVLGQQSISSFGALPGVVTLTLQGDADTPGNTTYYGTNGTGVKGFYAVASAFLGAAGDITLTTGTNGVTTIDLADVTNTGIGALFAIARDAKGRVVGYRAATITGTANRISVANGDASAGLPTIDIASSYAGQTSITTLGTVATGTWQATVIDATHGGTGQTAYAAGDILYASAANVLSRLPAGTNGQVLTLASGAPSWATASGSSPLTTKGDLYGFSTVNARIPVGTNGQVLTADSTAAAGVSWQPAGGGGGAMTLIGTTTLGANASDITVSGLNLSTAKKYLLQVVLSTATTTSWNASLYYNGDTTETNYEVQATTAQGGTLSTARLNNAYIGGTNGGDANDQCWCEVSIVADLKGRPRAWSNTHRESLVSVLTQTFGHIWTTASNVTSLTVHCSVANGFATGSYVKVFAVT